MFERGEQQPRHETPATTTRRTILRAAGLLGLTGAGATALTACAEESGGSPSPTPSRAGDICTSLAVAGRRRDFPQTFCVEGKNAQRSQRRDIASAGRRRRHP